MGAGGDGSGGVDGLVRGQGLRAAVSGPVVVVADVIVAAARVFRVSEAVLRAEKRNGVPAMRQRAMRAAREATGASFPAIGRAFGRDHTTVMHACRVAAGHPDVERIVAEARRRARRRQAGMSATYWGPAQLRAAAGYLLALAESMETGAAPTVVRNGH